MSFFQGELCYGCYKDDRQSQWEMTNLTPSCHKSSCMQDSRNFWLWYGFGVGLFNGIIEIYSPDDPCCHGNEIWDKIGYNLAYIRDIPEIFVFVYNRGFRGRAIERCQPNSTATNARCHSNEIWDKIGYNSAYIKDI